MADAGWGFFTRGGSVMKESNTNKPVALITGASRGIGKTIAKKLAQNNYRLALLSRSKSNLEQVARELELDSSDVLILDADVTNEKAVKNKITECAAYFGGIDVAVLNHGIYNKAFFNGECSGWKDVINVNLVASMYLTELLLPYLTKSNYAHKSLIYTASVASHMRYAGGAAYCTSKHGLLGFAHCIFEEVRETGLKVSALCPGFVNTDMASGPRTIGEKMIQPEDIATIVLNTLNLDSTVCPVEIIIRPQYSPYV